MKPFSSIIVLIALVLVSGSIGGAEEKSENHEGKLDRILEGQKDILRQGEMIYRQVLPLNPLAGKRYGIEFNPAYALDASAWGDTVLTGGVSLFGVDRHAEIAFPLYFAQFSGDSPFTWESIRLTVVNIDAHYRRFLGPVQGGWYLSGGGRYAYLRELNQYYIDNETTAAHKLGLAFGIGYRIFSARHLYWGFSLIVGRYYTGTNKEFSSNCPDCGKELIDIELLKIGYAF